jgi:hypothetical protein
MDKQYHREYSRRPEQKAKRAAYRQAHKKEIAEKNRRYVKARQLSGVYRVRCIPTGECYFGSTIHLYGRWRLHKSLLKRNKHHCNALQAAWNKYSADAFVYEIVEALSIRQAAILEKQLIKDNPSFNTY